MKNKTTLLSIVFFAAFGLKNSSASESDTNRIKIGDIKMTIIIEEKEEEDEKKEKEEKSHSKYWSKSENYNWKGIDFGLNGYFNPQQSLSMRGQNEYLELDYTKSLSWGVNFVEKGLKLGSENFKLVSGLGLSFHNYSFKNNYNIVRSPDSLDYFNVNGFNYSRNRLKMASLNVPIMFGINTSKDYSKSMRISVGAIAGVRFATRLKQQYEVAGDVINAKTRSDYHINAFHISPTLRVRYKGFGLFANYSLTPLFEGGKGPEIYPFTAGISFGFNPD
jgi:hypothetical protein